MIKTGSKIWFRTGDLPQELGEVKSYTGEGNYSVWVEDKKKLYEVNCIDITKILI